MTSPYSMGRVMRDHPSVVTWLEKLRGTTFAHGADLVETMLMADNVNIVDKILEALEEDGLAERVSFIPTVSQQFMGHGGMWAPDIKRIVRAGGLDLAPPSWCGWKPVRKPVDGSPAGPVAS